MIHRARILGQWEPLAVDPPAVRSSQVRRIWRAVAWLKSSGIRGAAVEQFDGPLWSRVARLAGLEDGIGIRTGTMICAAMEGFAGLPDESRRKEPGRKGNQHDGITAREETARSRESRRQGRECGSAAAEAQ